MMIRRVIQLGLAIVAGVLCTHVTVDARAAIISCNNIDIASMAPADVDQLPDPASIPQLHDPLTDDAMPGTGAPAVSVTMTFAGHAAIVAPSFTLPPPLVARILWDTCLIFPDPHPTGILRPPRWINQTT